MSPLLMDSVEELHCTHSCNVLYRPTCTVRYMSTAVKSDKRNVRQGLDAKKNISDQRS